MNKDYSFCILYDLYKGVLTAKQAEAFEYYYEDDLSLSEISENTGISRQGARDAIKRSEALLLETERQLGLSKRIQDIRGGASKILAAAQAAEAAIRQGNTESAVRCLQSVQAEAERIGE